MNKREAKRKPGPRLQALLDSGDAYLDQNTYLGKAADGEIVWLGNADKCAEIEDYLGEYPSPAFW